MAISYPSEEHIKSAPQTSRFGAYLAHRDQYTLPSRGSSLSPTLPSKYIFSFSFYFYFYIYTLV